MSSLQIDMRWRLQNDFLPSTWFLRKLKLSLLPNTYADGEVTAFPPPNKLRAARLACSSKRRCCCDDDDMASNLLLIEYREEQFMVAAVVARVADLNDNDGRVAMERRSMPCTSMTTPLL